MYFVYTGWKNVQTFKCTYEHLQQRRKRTTDKHFRDIKIFMFLLVTYFHEGASMKKVRDI